MVISQLVKTSQLKEGELEKVNSYLRTPLTESDIYMISVVLCSNEIDDNYEQFTEESLIKLSKLFVGKTGVFDNNNQYGNSTIRIISCEVKKIEGKKNKVGEDFYQLVARAFILKQKHNEQLINFIENGIVTEVSVGCSVRNTICSICDHDMRSHSCTHIKGKMYTIYGNNSKLCYGKLIDPLEAYEFSFVCNPSNIKERTVDMDSNENKKEVHTIPVVSMDTISLANKIYTKFGDNPDVIKGVSKIIDMIELDGTTLCLHAPEETFTFGCDEKEKCSECGNSIDPTPTSEDRDYVRIFSELSVDDLNKAIKQFEAEFEDKPYLIMSKDTLRVFEQYANNTLEATSCLNFDTNNIDCEDYDECIGCPYEPEEEGTVFIEHDCESGNSTACYFHNDEDYTITIDNDLAFGVVKVR